MLTKCKYIVFLIILVSCASLTISTNNEAEQIGQLPFCETENSIQEIKR